jgi:hypothetical protein
MKGEKVMKNLKFEILELRDPSALLGMTYGGLPPPPMVSPRD